VAWLLVVFIFPGIGWFALFALFAFPEHREGTHNLLKSVSTVDLILSQVTIRNAQSKRHLLVIDNTYKV
jgi:hypothetical protein